ncbi:glycosyltransferase family 4 protein [Rudaeicoccus suwonensis]|uniref:Glycosyltransferase involved in cell wall biosynthesis n=1 Tax=Rudaeicoccus suwonensis TaxID=657409 RepID=A0A561E8Q3_9MICO|nr:glycosyltransferase family 4 protein [Rudaeicoccus suwonensis]TWE11995.1 glycosyltransferase involved in cell wall biosynthesis [Rudaeicoccus suwonensis]
MSALTIAANNPTIGGGEVMLLAMADAARNAGRGVRIVAPGIDSEVTNAARDAGFDTVGIDSSTRGGYLRGLREWDRRHRRGVLWCNGLRPAVATAGRRGRVIHLHQIPSPRQQPLATMARKGSVATVVPSVMMQHHVPHSRVLANWTADAHPRSRCSGSIFVVGYLGRLSSDKGVPVLCAAIDRLRRRGTQVSLLIAGESRFVPPADAQLVSAAISELGDTARSIGWVSRSQFFDSVDLAVFPSVWAEPFGLVAAEAMAARCPFIVSDAGALPEVTGPDYPWVTAAGDPAALADRIEAAMTANWSATVADSRDRWESEFSPAAGAARFLELLDDVLVRAKGHV